MSQLFTGLVIGAGMNLIYSVVSLFGILNTSIQGFTNISYLMRNNPNCKNIMKIIDDELLLEVRIKVIKYFLDDVHHIKVSSDTKGLLEYIIENLNKCVTEIMDKIKEINEKIKYNDNLWLFQNIRKYDFTNDDLFLRNKSTQLEHLEILFYRVLESDSCYQKQKREINTNYNIEEDRMLQSTYIAEALFNKK
jgi:hypothetical protein